VSELFGEVKKDFSQKSGPREFGCVQKCKLLPQKITLTATEKDSILKTAGGYSPVYARCCVKQSVSLFAQSLEANAEILTSNRPRPIFLYEASSQNCEQRLLASSCPSVRPPA
jgi:hypothetical protein